VSTFRIPYPERIRCGADGNSRPFIFAGNRLSLKPHKVLEQHERKKKKYLKPCLETASSFHSFVVSTDGLIGKEAKTLLKKLSLG
jgi:hypothetical protein